VDTVFFIDAPIPVLRPTHGNRADPRQDLAFGTVAVATNTLAAIFRSQMAMLGKKGRDFGLYGLRQKPPDPKAEDFCQRVVRFPWLPKADNCIVCHGVSYQRP
jgi:hypothetical protein